MSDIIINVAAKEFISFSPTSVTLIREQNNTVISTFPYDILISNLNQLGVETTGTELICPSDTTNYTGRRVRELTYRILDSNGVLGPQRVASFMNTPQ